MNNDDKIEQKIQAKGLTAPRITPADIEANIASEHYFIASDAMQHENTVHVCKDGGWLLGGTQLLTFCVVQLRNGFTVTGESACASPENFDAEIGRKIARANAINKVWPLMGYELRSRLSEQAKPVEPCAVKVLPHQQRVLAEAVELDERLQKLSAFIDGEAFKEIDADEQARLTAQAGAMASYLAVLQERIGAFSI